MSNTKQLLKELTKAGYNIKRASEIVEEAKLRIGIFALDYVLGGGISQCEGGHRIEFFGAESSGKTTFCLATIKKFQEMGKTCAFIDAENSYDKDWATMMGVNNEDLIIIKPNSLEEAGNILYQIIPSVDLLVIDSIVGLIPLGELERNTEEVQMALPARVNSLITRKIYSALTNSKTTIIFINQLREKLGGYGNPFVTSGGHALKHLYNTRVEFKLGKPIDVQSSGAKERIGYEINLRCVKNKKGNPHRTSVIDFYFNGLIDNKKSLLHSAIKYSLITQKGSYYIYKDYKEQGKENLFNKLTDKDLQEIEEEIWKVLK